MSSLTERLGIRSVFVGGPFLSLINPETGVMSGADQRRFALLIDFFESRGCEVFNAHRREGWGRDLMPPSECSRLDYEGIVTADLFVAFPGHPASPGTHVEIGWATGMRKPVLLLLEEDRYYTFLVTGLPAWTRTHILRYDGALGFTAGLEEAVETLMAQGDPAAVDSLTLSAPGLE